MPLCDRCKCDAECSDYKYCDRCDTKFKVETERIDIDVSIIWLVTFFLYSIMMLFFGGLIL